MKDYPLPMRTTHLGYKHMQINAWGEFHPGVDLNYGRPQEDKGRGIIAPFDLEIVAVGRKPYYGRYVVGVNHDLGVVVRFLHLDRYKVAVGDFIEQGETFAVCGDDDGSNTKQYHGPGMMAHLHYDLLRLKEVQERGNNYLMWGTVVKNKSTFNEVFIDPSEFHPALRNLLKQKDPHTCRSANGKYVTYLSEPEI